MLIKICHKLEYFLVIFFMYLASCLSWKINLLIGQKLGLFIYYMLPFWRKITLKNLAFVYPQLKKAEIKIMAKKIYKNFGMTSMEFIQLKKINISNIDKFVEINGIENLDKAIKKRKGVILLTGHINNWEIMLTALSLKGYIINAMQRPQNNIYVDQLINKIRKEKGGKMISRGQGNRQALKVLKRGEILALLIDQNSALHGIFVDFFGKLASTVQGPAMFALHSDAEVIPLYSKRIGIKHYVKIFPAIKIIRTGNKEQDILINTANFTKIIESFIKENPLQWLWLHPRWNTRPKGEPSFY